MKYGTLYVERMGRASYGPMLWLQEQRHAEVADGTGRQTLFLLEHDPVVTLGKNSRDGNVLLPRDLLRARGVELFTTGRGGDVTFHGPGQIVGYPIVRLAEGEQDIKRFVWRLEEVLIRTVFDFGITASRVPGLRGIWVGDEKIGAIGVRIARWATMHGFALNVSTDLDYFRLIVPCGIADKGVTSLAKLLGAAPPLRAVEDRLVFHAAAVLERQAIEAEASSLPVAPLVPSMSADASAQGVSL
jgi:lipoyl(octanoyl) transferase